MNDFLKEENKAKAQEVMHRIINKEGFGCYVSFWDEKTVRVDGDLDIDDLKALVEAMENFV